MSERLSNYVTVAWFTAMTAALVDLLACVFLGASPLNLYVVLGLGFGAYASRDLVYDPMARIRHPANYIIIQQRLSIRGLLYLLFGGWAALLLGFSVGTLFHSTILLWLFGLIGAAAGAYCAFSTKELRAPDLFRQ